MQCINEKFCLCFFMILAILSISNKFKPPVEIIFGILFFTALFNKLKSLEETLAILRISNLNCSITFTEFSSKGVQAVSNLFFYIFKKFFKL